MKYIYTTLDNPITVMAQHRLQTALQHENHKGISPVHKLHNVNVAFQLVKDADIHVKSRVLAEDIVDADPLNFYSRFISFLHETL